MRSMHTLCCPLCSLRFVNQPTLEHHVREDHAPAQEPEHRETLSVLASPLRRAEARTKKERARALTWR